MSLVLSFSYNSNQTFEYYNRSIQLMQHISFHKNKTFIHVISNRSSIWWCCIHTYVHTCIISNSSLLSSLFLYQYICRWKRVKFNSYHQEQLSCSIDSIVHHRLTSLVFFLFSSCLSVSHGNAHKYRSDNHSKNMYKNEKCQVNSYHLYTK